VTGTTAVVVLPEPQYRIPGGWSVEWEFPDDVGDLLKVIGQRGYGMGRRVCVYIREEATTHSESFVWLRPELARAVAGALLAAADHADSKEVNTSE
jgi:hypothetical protein